MERIEVRLTMDPSKRPDNMQELVKHEREVVDQWRAAGHLETFYLRPTHPGAIFIFKDIDEAKVKALISALPLFPYFKEAEYNLLAKQF